jgi:hypothetical protein
LPKGIWVHKNQNSFVYGLTVNGKRVHVFISKNLKEVVNARLEFIT